VDPALGAELLDRHASELGELVGDPLRLQHVAVHHLGILFLEPEVERGERRHGAGDPDCDVRPDRAGHPVR
jgi:hypothetical protein